MAVAKYFLSSVQYANEYHKYGSLYLHSRGYAIGYLNHVADEFGKARFPGIIETPIDFILANPKIRFRNQIPRSVHSLAPLVASTNAIIDSTKQWFAHIYVCSSEN